MGNRDLETTAVLPPFREQIQDKEAQAAGEDHMPPESLCEVSAVRADNGRTERNAQAGLTLSIDVKILQKNHSKSNPTALKAYHTLATWSLFQNCKEGSTWGG